jgi:hypothetical protein
MIIKFNIELPYVIRKDCEKKLKEVIKEEVNRAIQMYGVFEVVARVRPKGVREPTEEEMEPFGGKKFWFEEYLEEK